MIDYKKSVEEILIAIDNSEDIFLASHMNPDGDSIGSLMALGLALEQYGKKVNIIKTDAIPEDFDFLPSIDRIKEYEDIDADIFFVLDCGNKDRIGKYEEFLDESKLVVNIDHHMDNTKFGDINLVDPNRASTGEVVFDLIEGLGLRLDKDIATHIYTAISTDTGRFMYDKVNDRTHEIAAKLIRAGIDKDKINIHLYQTKSLAATRLFIEGISTLRTYHDDKIGTIKITQDLLNRVNASLDDGDDLIVFIRDIVTTEVACVLKEVKENEIKISLRSKTIINVSSIANQFNGGGHKKAAGCTIYQDIDTAERLIVDAIEKAMRN